LHYPETMLVALSVPESLCGCVDGIWTHTGQDQPHRVLPDGCLDFIFNLRSGTAVVVGPMSHGIVVPMRLGVTSFGVRFRPGHGARFIEADASELLDTRVALAALTRLSSLAERITEAHNHAERSALIECALLDATARTRPVDTRVERAVHLIYRARGRVSVGVLAASVGLGERQLERRFLERVGMSPKRLARVVRFERALQLCRRHDTTQADIAAQAGYSDEPHLLRDFRVFSGLTPGALRREQEATRPHDVGFVQGEGRGLG
jgi:AraC-like DNA-binding protein